LSSYSLSIYLFWSFFVLSIQFFFSLLIPPPLRSTLFPYTTLFRSYKELFFLQKKHYQSNLFQTHTSHPLNQLVLKFRPHLKRTGECLSNQVHHYITLF